MTPIAGPNSCRQSAAPRAFTTRATRARASPRVRPAGRGIARRLRSIQKPTHQEWARARKVRTEPRAEELALPNSVESGSPSPQREAVGLLASSGRPLSRIAQELGIAPSRLRAWRNRDEGVQAGSPRRPNTQEAIRRRQSRRLPCSDPARHHDLVAGARLDRRAALAHLIEPLLSGLPESLATTGSHAVDLIAIRTPEPGFAILLVKIRLQ